MHGGRELRGKPVGTFMLRESGSQPGCYVLSVSPGGTTVWHGIVTINTTAAGDKLCVESAQPATVNAGVVWPLAHCVPLHITVPS